MGIPWNKFQFVNVSQNIILQVQPVNEKANMISLKLGMLFKQPKMELGFSATMLTSWLITNSNPTVTSVFPCDMTSCWPRQSSPTVFISSTCLLNVCLHTSMQASRRPLAYKRHPTNICCINECLLNKQKAIMMTKDKEQQNIFLYNFKRD